MWFMLFIRLLVLVCIFVLVVCWVFGVKVLVLGCRKRLFDCFVLIKILLWWGFLWFGFGCGFVFCFVFCFVFGF